MLCSQVLPNAEIVSLKK